MSVGINSHFLEASLVISVEKYNRSVLLRVGIAADPAKKYPQYFPEDGLFGQYPYLLPSVLAGIVCFVPAIVIFFKLPETRHRKICAM